MYIVFLFEIKINSIIETIRYRFKCSKCHIEIKPKRGNGDLCTCLSVQMCILYHDISTKQYDTKVI